MQACRNTALYRSVLMNIRPCLQYEVGTILEVINDGAEAYRKVIPGDCWKEPYMTEAELRSEIADGVVFWCAEEAGEFSGVMGLQLVGGVALIRHSYVRTAMQGRGIGKALLQRLLVEAECPVLAGTWATAEWAIRFYSGMGFTLQSRPKGEELLRKYWKIPARQVVTSVVLGDARWIAGSV